MYKPASRSALWIVPQRKRGILTSRSKLCLSATSHVPRLLESRQSTQISKSVWVCGSTSERLKLHLNWRLLSEILQSAKGVDELVGEVAESVEQLVGVRAFKLPNWVFFFDKIVTDLLWGNASGVNTAQNSSEYNSNSNKNVKNARLTWRLERKFKNC